MNYKSTVIAYTLASTGALLAFGWQAWLSIVILGLIAVYDAAAVEHKDAIINEQAATIQRMSNRLMSK